MSFCVDLFFALGFVIRRAVTANARHQSAIVDNGILSIALSSGGGSRKRMSSAQHRDQEHVDIGCQTTDDLVEMWLPCLRRRIVRHSGGEGTISGGASAGDDGVNTGDGTFAGSPDHDDETIATLRQRSWSTDPKTRQKEVPLCTPIISQTFHKTTG